MWFEEKISYQGELDARFVDGTILQGQATVEFDQRGICNIKVRRNDQSLPKGCTSVMVTTETGKLIAEDIVAIHTEIQGQHILIRLLQSKFDILQPMTPKYWVMPLMNYMSDFNSAIGPIRDHPLRVSKITSAESTQQNEQTQQITHLNRLTNFYYNDACGFIEPLPDYNERCQMLERCLTPVITSLMIGEIGSNSIEAEDLKTWFPIDYLLLLSLASGVEIGGSWIEFRDQNGGLVRRLHIAFKRPVFAQGEKVLDDAGYIGGTGGLLTCAAECDEFGKIFLHVFLHHLVKANNHVMSLDDRLAHLIRGIDGLIKFYNVGNPNLLNGLDTSLTTEIKNIIKDASGKIAKLVKGLTNNEQSQAVSYIKERVSNGCYYRSDQFGDAFRKLLSQFQLQDYQIIDAHFGQKPLGNCDSFDKVLSYLRGATIHEGYFSINNTLPVEKVGAVVNHVFDIAVRIVLKILVYKGTYDSPMWTQVKADWVKPETPAIHLGYE